MSELSPYDVPLWDDDERLSNDERRFEYHRRLEELASSPSPPTPYKSPELRLVLFLRKLPLRVVKSIVGIPWFIIGVLIYGSLVLHGRKGLWYEHDGLDVKVRDIYSPGFKKGIEWRDEFDRG